MSGTRGLLLAAGAGRRRGEPKALARDADGTSWLLRALGSLRACDGVTVVIGAAAPQVARQVPPSVQVVHAADWADGMGASLRAGLDALAGADHDAALVTLVDLPDVDGHVVQRVLGSARGPGSLARAVYGGRPGHPVLLGRDHWPAATQVAVGDEGARVYLERRADLTVVECGDLATGRDLDHPADFPLRRDVEGGSVRA